MSIASCAAISRRSPGAVADQVRDGPEPQDRQGARPGRTPIDSAARRRGDRVGGGAGHCCIAVEVRSCAGFRTPVPTMPTTRSGGRRPKSAKAPGLEMPQWAADLIRELGSFIGTRAHRKAAGDAGELSFFENGMLASLKKIARGDGAPEDQDELQKQLSPQRSFFGPFSNLKKQGCRGKK